MQFIEPDETGTSSFTRTSRYIDYSMYACCLQEKLFHIWLNSFFVAGGERGELKFEHHTSSRSSNDGDIDGAMNRASAPMSDSSRMLLQETRGESGGQPGHSPQQTTRAMSASASASTGDQAPACNTSARPARDAHVHGVGCANHQCPVCQMELVGCRAPMECDLSCENVSHGGVNVNRSSPTQTQSPAPTASWPFVGSQTAISTDVPVAASRSPDIQIFPQKRADRSSDILLDFYKCDLDRAHKDRNDKLLPRNFQVPA